MASGDTPGNGRVNPFGNGTGGSSGGNVAGNNFITNPRGSGGGAAPRNFIDASRTQTRATPEARGVNSKDAAPGPVTAAEVANNTNDPGNPVGVGTIGNSAVPFKLGG